MGGLDVDFTADFNAGQDEFLFDRQSVAEDFFNEGDRIIEVLGVLGCGFSPVDPLWLDAFGSAIEDCCA